jgi:hypothetical protein
MKLTGACSVSLHVYRPGRSMAGCAGIHRPKFGFIFVNSNLVAHCLAPPILSLISASVGLGTVTHVVEGK